MAEKTSEYGFRIRFRRSQRSTIGIADTAYTIEPTDESAKIELLSTDNENNVQQAENWALKGASWPSEVAAREAGQMYQDALSLSLARLRVGADFGWRTPPGQYFESGLKDLEETKGLERVLNDVHGLMVYDLSPSPHFARLDVSSSVTKPKETFEELFHQAVSSRIELSDKESLSLELFHSSFFHPTEDGRFLSLMMAIEALLEIQPRSQIAIGHVEDLIRLTRESQSLSEGERDSIVGSLEHMKKDSIGQAGRRLAKKRVAHKQYNEGMSPDRFFMHCYDLRSRMVHGAESFPKREEIQSIVTELERFVSELLCDPKFN